jgi:hypothetical protein
MSPDELRFFRRRDAPATVVTFSDTNRILGGEYVWPAVPVEVGDGHTLAEAGIDHLHSERDVGGTTPASRRLGGCGRRYLRKERQKNWPHRNRREAERRPTSSSADTLWVP